MQENMEKTQDEGWQHAKKGRKMTSSNLESKDPQEEKGKESKQGEKEVTKNNKFNVLSVEEGEIILNEETLEEGIAEPYGILVDNNIPTSSHREERIDAEMEGSPSLGGMWDERVKQSIVSSFARSPDTSSNGS